MRPLASLLIACALLALAAPLVDAQSDAFLLALVRDDGVMLPVAAHDRGRWRMPWPGPAKEAVVPIRLEDCPRAWWGLPTAPREWTLWTPGESPRQVTVDRPTWVPSFCQQQVVLHSRTATRPVLRDAEGGRAPTYGVAIAGPGTVTLPRPVPTDDPEARVLLDGLQQAFNREERLMLAEDYFAVYQPSIDAEQRDRMPVQARSIHAGPGRTGGPTYYVELMRHYPRRMPEHLQWCDEVTYMAGWVRQRQDDSLDLTLVTRAVTSCLLDTMQRSEPLAIVHTARGPVWMLELYRPDSQVLGMFLAPSDEFPEPVLIRDLGRCEPGQRPRRGAPTTDTEVP